MNTHAGGLRPEKITATPPWASFLTLDAWRALLVAFEAELHDRGWIARYQWDHFAAATAEGNILELAVVNCAERCRGLPIEDIRGVVRAHLDRVIDPSLKPQSGGTEAGGDVPYEGVAPHLIAHVYTEDAIAEAREPIVVRPLAEGIVLAVAIDLGPAIAALPRALSNRWNVSDDELFRRGAENVRRRRVRRDPIPVPGLTGFTLIGDETTATQVMFLSETLGARYPAGVLVGMPTRNTLVCVLLQSCDALASATKIRATVGMLGDFFRDISRNSRSAVRALTPNVYWWRDGELTRLRATMIRGQVVLEPPEGFIEAVLANAPSVFDA